jgi:hypothetical protein
MAEQLKYPFPRLGRYHAQAVRSDKGTFFLCRIIATDIRIAVSAAVCLVLSISD